jgi:hypothetical protein
MERTRAERPATRSRFSWSVAVALCLGAVPTAQAAVPYQFIAKIYSEALGRIPDQGGWQEAVQHFEAHGCSRNTLKSWGRGSYLSKAYAELGYDNAAKVLTLYRGILNREPDRSGFDIRKGQLDSGTPLSSVADSLFDGAEFGSLVRAICKQPSYGFGNAPVIDLPISGGGFQGTQSGLQSLIDATSAGGTVWLAQKAVIRLTSPLVLDQGKTLATIGSPDPRHYALMARLVRETSFGDAAVQLSGGAKLQSLWIDGSRGRLGFHPDSLNLLLLGGSGTTVSNCLINNSAGWTHLVALGSFEGRPCAGNAIDHNLVTAYASTHTGSGWTDGLSIACENAIVEHNEVIDATDVPIVIYRATPAVQRSQVRFNQILNAGNSAYGGLCADHGMLREGETSRLDDFTGSSFHDNVLWSGAGHFDIALAVGTRAWWSPAASAMGTGAAFTHNTTGSQKILTDVGIGVSGMLDANVQGNTLSMRLANVSRCPAPIRKSARIVASVRAGWASGTIQGPYSQVAMAACIGHPSN